MDLGLAGAISGAGEAGTKALANAQMYVATSALQAERDKMDTARQERLIAANQAMQTEKIAADDVRTTKEIASREGLAGKEIASREGLAGKEIASREGLAGKEIASREGIAKDTNQVHKDINTATNAMHERVAALQRRMQEKQFDKTFTASKLDALKSTIRELGNEITRLSVLVGNPLADKQDANYQAAVEQLKSATRLHNLYSQQVGIESKIDPVAIEKAIGGEKSTRPAFRQPTIGAAPSVGQQPTERGMVQVPMPSTTEQEMMRKSIQR